MAECLTFHKTMPVDFDYEICHVLLTAVTLSSDEHVEKYDWNMLQNQYKTVTITYLMW